ncbi:uncharacterized protein [Anabrus simplex]|uniref:uncharacterized protein n=1 Tax=Anabrus simplex TaxID=316456 RepID=UPI0035A2CF04
MGFGFLTLFFILVISGLAVFEGLAFYDRFDTMEIRARFVTYHNILGVIFFLMSVGLIISGVTEYAGIPLNIMQKSNTSTKFAEVNNIFTFSNDTEDASQDPFVWKHYFKRHAATRMVTLLYVCSTIPVMYALTKEEFRYRGRIILTLDRELSQT